MKNCFITKRGFAILNHILPENTFRYKEAYPNIFSFGDGALIVPVTAERAKQLRLEYLADNTNKRMVDMKNWDTLHEKLYQLATVSPIVPVEWYKEAEVFLDKAISDVENSLKRSVLDIDENKLTTGLAWPDKWNGTWVVAVENVGFVPFDLCNKYKANLVSVWFNYLSGQKPKWLSFDRVDPLHIEYLHGADKDRNYCLTSKYVGVIGQPIKKQECVTIKEWYALFLKQKISNQQAYNRELQYNKETK